MEGLFRNSPEEQERIGRHVGQFSVALSGVNDSPDFRNVRLVGSGTLVSTNQTRYVLTAAHVWHHGLAKYKSTGLTLREDIDHCFPILNAAITVQQLAETKMDQWGPDVVLLRIPDMFVGTIEAYRSFYNLDKEPKKLGKVTSELESWSGRQEFWQKVSETFKLSKFLECM